MRVWDALALVPGWVSRMILDSMIRYPFLAMFFSFRRSMQNWVGLFLLIVDVDLQDKRKKSTPTT